MKCLRCGHCCKKYIVVIVDNPDLGIRDDNLISYLGDSRCKHLLGDTIGEYSCAIHDKPWFKDTPCYAHSQIEQENSNCRLGEYLLKNMKEYKEDI